jgi:hypothetical protein
MFGLVACVTHGDSVEPAASLPSDPQLSSALDSMKASFWTDLSGVAVNTKETTDESRTDDLQITGAANVMNTLAQPGQVTAYPRYENLAEVDTPPANGRPQKKRIAKKKPLSFFDSHSDCVSAAPIGPRKMAPPSVSSRKNTRRRVAGGGGRALPNKYNLGHLKPLFNGKCCRFCSPSEHSMQLLTNLQKSGRGGLRGMVG